MRIARILLPVALAALTIACAGTGPKTLAAGALPVDGPVSVGWEDPNQFTEIRHATDRWQATREDWLTPLAEHLRASSARHLLPGQQLRLTIIDVDRAGGFEPWLGPDYQQTRIMRDIYPPRMTVRHTLSDATGNTLAEGESTLSDLSYLQTAAHSLNSDPLRYEKRMIDTWAMREFGQRNAGN